MKKIFAAALIGIFSSTPLFAAWAVVSLNELVRDSDLIVIGTLHSATEDDGIGRGRIQVEEVISGRAVTKEGEPLSIGDNLRIEWADNWACAMGMHRRRIGVRGVWLLEVEDNGTVSAAYPGRFTDLDELAEIKRLLRGFKAKRLSKVDVSDQFQRIPHFTTTEVIQLHTVDTSPYPDHSLLRALGALFVATALYGFLYRSRFRIR